jgi:ATP-dependent exoDNAse (exonuclease V) alpha subunit
MEKAGFPSPQTVSAFLKRGDLAEGAVVIVDEAGQIGGRQMLELMRLVRGRTARLILSGDTRQHGPVEASDALVAIERHAGVKPVELHRIRRQDPARARDRLERSRIRGYRAAVEAAANGDMPKSFDRLEGIGAVVACRLGEQADKLGDEYVRLAAEGASTVVVSQTWTEVHRVNSKVREGLKSKGLLGTTDTPIQVLDRLDLTNAQKRDERFHPPEAVLVFNQKVRDADPGAKGKLAGILKSGLLVEVNGKFVSVSNRLLDRISVCLEREIQVALGDRLHVKANRKLISGQRVTNGELVTVKSVQSDGGVELTDGRVLDASFREFLPGYAVTSYGSQGKTVDYVLFSDSTIKAATNAQQWYVSISRGRRGIRIFTPDKEQLRENILRSGHRPLALELAKGLRDRTASPLWRRLHGRLLRFGRKAVANLRRVNFLHPRTPSTPSHHEHQSKRMLGE